MGKIAKTKPRPLLCFKSRDENELHPLLVLVLLLLLQLDTQRKKAKDDEHSVECCAVIG
jgi:hypothetical protein